jgi:type II secretory pathway component PulF
MQGSLLRLLSIAHAQRLEVMPLVANFAEEHRGAYRRQLRRLALRLADGNALVDALEQTPEVLRDDVVLSLRFANQTGTLEPTYRHLVEIHDASSNRVEAILRQTIFYTFVTVLILALLLSFLMVFIVPTLEHMLEELGIDESASALWAFRAMIDSCVHLSNYWPLWLFGVILIAVLCGSSWSRRFFRRVIATRWVRSAAQARSAELLRLLSFAVEAGRPLPAALSTLARYHFDRNVRQALLFARNEVEQGADVWTSLAKARLLTTQESDALANSSSSQSRAWAMRHLADWKHDQVCRRTESRIAMARPLATLALAAVVLLVGSAMIGFLAHFIHISA